MEWIEDYKKLLAFKSISSEDEYKNDLLNCFNWVKEQVEACGFKTERWDTAGHPVIFGTYVKNPAAETLLIYNHYDVQPVDPLELWKTPPFEPTIIDGVMYARGAQDNKGQLFYTLLALRTLYKEKGEYPLNIKWIIEGEEEIGSKHLEETLKAHKDALKADHVAIIDVGIPNAETPAVTLGLRGLFTMDVTAQGTKGDLHSGSHGGLAYNPLFALVELLAKAKDENGKIAIPGFYDKINPLTDEEKKTVSFDFNLDQYKKDFGTIPTGGEKQLTHLERNWLRPTFEINGLWGGYNGAGFKTVIPAQAFAKVSCRIVRGQDPLETGALVKNWLEANAPEGITISAVVHKGVGSAVLSNPHSKVVKAFAQAFTEVFNKPCKYVLEGASIPIVPALAQISGGEVVLVGLGLVTDQIHAPNEHFGLDRIEKGSNIVQAAIHLLAK